MVVDGNLPPFSTCSLLLSNVGSWWVSFYNSISTPVLILVPPRTAQARTTRTTSIRQIGHNSSQAYPTSSSGGCLTSRPTPFPPTTTDAETGTTETGTETGTETETGTGTGTGTGTEMEMGTTTEMELGTQKLIRQRLHQHQPGLQPKLQPKLQPFLQR